MLTMGTIRDSQKDPYECDELNHVLQMLSNISFTDISVIVEFAEKIQDENISELAESIADAKFLADKVK